MSLRAEAEVSLAFRERSVTVKSCSSRLLAVASFTVVALPPSFAISLFADWILTVPALSSVTLASTLAVPVPAVRFCVTSPFLKVIAFGVPAPTMLAVPTLFCVTLPSMAEAVIVPLFWATSPSIVVTVTPPAFCVSVPVTLRVPIF